MTTAELADPRTGNKLLVRSALAWGADPNDPRGLMETLKQTCFKTDKPITDHQMKALLLVCEANKLNPFAKMVYALLDKSGIVVPYVGFDGWVSLVTRRPEYNGHRYVWSDDRTECTCIMFRKDHDEPTEITEYLAEVKRGSTPWSTMPRRMLRHRAYVQCAREAFGFPGLYDEFEAREIAFGVREPAQPLKPSRGPLRPPAADEVPPEADPLALDDDEYPPRTLASWMAEMLDADDQETASLVLDEAKALLPIEQHNELGVAFRAKWTTKE